MDYIDNRKALYYWPFVKGLHRWSVESPHKEPVMGKVAPRHDVSVDKNLQAGHPYRMYYALWSYIVKAIGTLSMPQGLWCLARCYWYTHTHLVGITMWTQSYLPNRDVYVVLIESQFSFNFGFTLKQEYIFLDFRDVFQTLVCKFGFQ